jgi:serine/threonine-protein kinase
MAPASLEGQTLGKYRVMEPLGRGGMARVYRAYHPQLDRYVAIKVLRADLAEDEEFLTRFRREAQAVAALRHPNIVQVFDSDVQGDVYYMVLELLEGDTLKARLNDYRVRDDRMALGEVVRIMLDVLDGLAYAHSEGMIHRDIKPGNVLLTKRGQAVIADFGIAHIVGGTRHTISGALMGTLNYMAPEQGFEGHSDVRSDIYSLGVVLYEMMTRRTPFEADTPLAVLMKHLNDPLPLPRQIEPGIPEPFERIVLKALSKQPEDRYQSAEQMAQALREAAEEAEIELRSRISLPLSFTTPGSASESVAVFSGTAREGLADVEFADDDTDPTLGQRLAAGGPQPALSVRQELKSAVGVLGRLVAGQTAKAIRQAMEAVESRTEESAKTTEAGNETREPAAEPSEGSEAVFSDVSSAEDPDTEFAAVDPDISDVPLDTMPDAKFAAAETGTVVSQQLAAEDSIFGETGERKRVGVVVPIVIAVGILLAGNSVMVTLAGLLDWWEIYEYGWTVELFLVTLGLCVIMLYTRVIWLLIPIGIILVNGVALSFCQILNAWGLCSVFWILDLWIVAGIVFLTIWLGRQGEWARRLSRPLAQLLGLASAVSILVVVVATAVIGVFDLVF